MSLISGSRGLIYFVHEFKPRFQEAALLEDPITLKAVTELNHQISDLAPVLNEPNVSTQAQVRLEKGSIKTMFKRHDGTTYVFAVEMTGNNASAELSLRDSKAATKAEVLGENRTLPFEGGTFKDSFGPWDVHLYKLK